MSVKHILHCGFGQRVSNHVLRRGILEHYFLLGYLFDQNVSEIYVCVFHDTWFLLHLLLPTGHQNESSQHYNHLELLISYQRISFQIALCTSIEHVIHSAPIVDRAVLSSFLLSHEVDLLLIKNIWPIVGLRVCNLSSKLASECPLVGGLCHHSAVQSPIL